MTCRIVDIKNYRIYVFPCVLLFSINFVKTKTTLAVIEQNKELFDKIHSLAELGPYLSKRNIANNIILHHIPQKCKHEPYILGVDKAGRGHVLGKTYFILELLEYM